MPATTPLNSRRLLATSHCWRWSSPSLAGNRPKRSELSAANGRAPMVKISRMIPPTPVAAPWKGSTALGMIVRLDFEGDGQSVADVDDARHSLRPRRRESSAIWSERFSATAGVLVGAMLAPHHREDAQLGIVGLAAQGFLDCSYSSGVRLCFLTSSGVMAGSVMALGRFRLGGL